jgi:hypothetical protein
MLGHLLSRVSVFLLISSLNHYPGGLVGGERRA